MDMATVTEVLSPENRMPEIRVATWLALASVTAVTACAPRDATCAGTCGTVVVDIGGAPETLLPVLAISVDALAIGSLMFLPLAEIGNDLNFVGDEGFQPRIARSWTFEDSVTIVFERATVPESFQMPAPWSAVFAVIVPWVIVKLPEL